MKANEIQIGDWLYYKGQFNAFPFKVESITKKKVGYHAEPNEHRMYYLRLSECKPIPLTLEILEKNGFEYKEGEIGLYGVKIAPHYTRDDVPFEVFCDGEPFAIWFKEPVNIKFVHQLQHALRLCGIEKTIELWKQTHQRDCI